MSIAALNGTLAGGAMGMALACDMIAVASAKFFYPVMKLGYLPQPSDPMRMRALIGPARAKMIPMGGYGKFWRMRRCPLARLTASLILQICWIMPIP